MIKHTMNDHSWFFLIPHKNFRFSILPGPRWPMVALAALAPSPSSGGEKQRPAAAWERWLFNPSGFLAKKMCHVPSKIYDFLTGYSSKMWWFSRVMFGGEPTNLSRPFHRESDDNPLLVGGFKHLGCHPKAIDELKSIIFFQRGKVETTSQNLGI